jgi:hypothetical protein
MLSMNLFSTLCCILDVPPPPKLSLAMCAAVPFPFHRELRISFVVALELGGLCCPKREMLCKRCACVCVLWRGCWPMERRRDKFFVFFCPPAGL